MVGKPFTFLFSGPGWIELHYGIVDVPVEIMVLFLVQLMPSFSLVLLNLNLNQQEQLCPFWRMSLL